MKRFSMALAVLAGWAALAARPASALTVKYEFLRDGPNVVMSAGNANFCGAGTYLNGSATINFTDPYVGGGTVTFQAGFQCQTAASSLQVNGVASGTMGGSTGSCCTTVFQVVTATITTNYNNGSPNKSIFLPANISGSVMPLTGLFNTTDPMFRVNVTLLPGPGIGASTGTFTNSTNPTLAWPPITGAASYQVQIAADPFFNSPVVDQSGLATNSMTVGTALVNGSSYYARVRSSGGAFSGVWSYVTDFTVAQTLPSTPVLVSPANPSNVPVQTPTFNWNPVTLGSE